MPISHPYKLIFVHIPKTGGTSVEYALGIHGEKDDIGIKPYWIQKKDYHFLYGSGLQHMTIQEIIETLRISNFNSYLRFGRTKRRFDFLKALFYKNILKKEFTGNFSYNNYYTFSIVRNPYDRLVSHFAWLDQKWYKNIPAEKEKFNDFIEYSHSKKLFESNRHLLPQYKYITEKNKVVVDILLHFENLRNEFTQLCQEFNIQVDLPTRMVSKHEDYFYYYTQHSKKLVYNIYQKDFELFGYSKLYE